MVSNTRCSGNQNGNSHNENDNGDYGNKQHQENNILNMKHQGNEQNENQSYMMLPAEVVAVLTREAQRLQREA